MGAQRFSTPEDLMEARKMVHISLKLQDKANKVKSALLLLMTITNETEKIQTNIQKR